MKNIGKAFICTIVAIAIIVAILVGCNGGDMFTAIFILGVGIIFTIFLCTFMIIDAIEEK